MGNPQQLKFSSMQAFLSYLPDEQLEIVELLRALVLEEHPAAQEKLAYNVPFYYLPKRFCYIWPAAIPWGGIRSGVALGFMAPHMMRHATDPKAKLFSVKFEHITEVDAAYVRFLLREALLF